MQASRSAEAHRVDPETHSFVTREDRQGLVNAYEENSGFGLKSLADESEQGLNRAGRIINGRYGGSFESHRKIRDQIR